MVQYQRVVAALKKAGLDCPAARYLVWGMLEAGEPFGVVVERLAVYLGIRRDVLEHEFSALCWPKPAVARFSEIIKEVLENESGIHA